MANSVGPDQTAFFSGVVWSGSTLFALFENLGSLRQFHHVENGYQRFEEIRLTTDLETHVLNKKYFTLVYELRHSICNKLKTAFQHQITWRYDARWVAV